MNDEVTESPLSSPDKAALLLMALGEDQAAEVLKYMEPKEVQIIGTQMKTLSNITQNQISEVLDEFIKSVGSQTSLSIGSESYLQNILEKALGKDKSQNIMSRISMNTSSKGLDMLKWMDAQAIYELIKNEHPQIISIVIISLEQEQASGVLNLLPDELRTDIIFRVANMDGINPAALTELDTIMENNFNSDINMKVSNVGGVRAAAELLNKLRPELSTEVLDKINELDSDLGTDLQDQMFIFENLLELDDRGIQTLLREVSTDELVVALKGASHEMQEKVFGNMSKRAAEMLRDDFETRGPTRLKDVEEAQKNILTVARNLAEEGKIMLSSGGDDFV